MAGPQILTKEEILEQGVDTALPGTVILHNDDYNTFEDVIFQIMKAVHCTRQKAEHHTHEVHYKGQSKVYHGPLEECLTVSTVLEEIQLTTTIEI